MTERFEKMVTVAGGPVSSGGGIKLEIEGLPRGIKKYIAGIISSQKTGTVWAVRT